MISGPSDSGSRSTIGDIVQVRVLWSGSNVTPGIEIEMSPEQSAVSQLAQLHINFMVMESELHKYHSHSRTSIGSIQFHTDCVSH